MAIGDIKAIDAVMNLQTPEVVQNYRPKWSFDFLGNKIGAPEETVRGLPIERILEKMDIVGIERAFLIAAKCGPIGHPANYQLPYEVVRDVVQRYPDRFYGLAGIDPTEGMKGVRALEHAIKELGFVGAHFYPHWFEMPPDHRKVYPFYAKCVELDIPIQMQVGHCLRYSAERPLPSVGRPITLDTVACDFPDLKLIGIHIGWPWTEEMISVAYKHPNVYIGCDAYAPRYWAKEFVHFINTFGQDKVIFGTDFPVVDIERAIREIEELELRPIPKRKLLRENTIRAYKLDLPA
ncbi:MAG: amidohydrolase [Chloroflexi bacterium]|nr:amidohydrolase [Chloroflexota bacterium]